MFDISRQLGVQSWCFRHFKEVPVLLEQIKALGLSRLELCGVHADFSNPATFEAVAQSIKDAGVTISSFGVQYFDGKPEEENWFKCAKIAGISMIATSFALGKMPDVLTKTVALAEKYDIKLGLHNHGGYDWLGSNKMLNHIFESTPPVVGSCLDTAWMIQSGEDPIKFADKWADRLYGVHIKDFTFGPNGKWTDVVVGTGNVQLRELMAIVTGKAAAACQCVTLEYEGDIENPLPKLVECLEMVRKSV